MEVSVKAGQNPPIYDQRQDGNLVRLRIVGKLCGVHGQV
jgi:hypothetical protein